MHELYYYIFHAQLRVNESSKGFFQFYDNLYSCEHPASSTYKAHSSQLTSKIILFFSLSLFSSTKYLHKNWKILVEKLDLPVQVVPHAQSGCWGHKYKKRSPRARSHYKIYWHWKISPLLFWTQMYRTSTYLLCFSPSARITGHRRIAWHTINNGTAHNELNMDF